MSGQYLNHLKDVLIPLERRIENERTVPYAGDRLSVLLSRITSHATLTDEAASAETGGARTAGKIRLLHILKMERGA